MAVTDRHLTARAQRRPLAMPAVLTIALIAVGLAGLLPLLLGSMATTTASNVRQLQRQRDNWEARTHELQAEIATLGALDHIEKEARERLGMEPPAETIYITVDVPRPEEQFVPLRFLPAKTEKVETKKSWWESLLDLLPIP